MSRTFRRLALMISVPALLAIGCVAYFLVTAQYVSTENAYIRQDKVSVSAEVGGRIVEVAVRENQPVTRGQLLFRVDPEPFELAVQEAEAAVATAEAQLEVLQIAFQTSSVDIENALEDVAYFEEEYQRQLRLQATSVTTDAAIKAAKHALAEARAKLASARADKVKAKAALSTGDSDSRVYPALRAAQAQLKQARLNLSRTDVRAPVDGVVSQADRLQVGQHMMPALPALSIIKNNTSWVEANFKETDLTDLRINQPATLRVDAFPDLQLHGSIESIGGGTGSEFSILPAQNASGNWVKVTQRIPVRIAIKEQLARPLIAGLSVYVRVDTQ